MSLSLGSPRDFSALSVMVVEDHDFQRRMALQMVKSLGVVKLAEAINGRLALAYLASDSSAHPDIILTDLDMPEMDGIELIRHVAEQHLAHAVVIASSLDAAMLQTVEAMSRAYGLQVLGAVEKPLTAARIQEAFLRYRAPGEILQSATPGAAFSVDDLRLAITNREILLNFQPKVHFATGEVVGAEALVRWQRPGYGKVPPDLFMPLVEREQLIDALTDAILEQACAVVRGWKQQGLDIGMSVNISMLNLSDVSTADRYADIARAQNCEPRQITLELTETAVMKEAAKALNVLARLRLKGFGLSIDDFGTGYSSMQQLSAIPFTELKIDQSFVRGCDRNDKLRGIVEASHELARKLKLKVVAEGVETRQEWDVLARMGADQAQGWYVAQAMAADEFLRWARAWKLPPA